MAANPGVRINRVAPVNYAAIGYKNAKKMIDQYMVGSMDSVYIDNKIYGIPLELVHRDGEIITRRGFCFRYPYYLISMIPMVEQLGGKLVSDDGKTAIVGDDACSF